MELDNKAIGKRVYRVRNAKKFSQWELTELVDVCTSHISNIERGKKSLGQPLLVGICNALN